MSYKIVRKNEATPYTAPGHYDMRPTRIHQAGDVNQGKMTMGVSYFLPGGGCEYGSNAFESIYYIIDGQMELITEDTKTTLQAGDSFHCGPNTLKSIQNNGTDPCKMLVVLTRPE